MKARVAALAFLLALPAAAQEDGPRPIRRLELKDAAVVDAVRLIAETSGLNVVTTSEAGKEKVTLYLQNVTPRQAIEALCKVAGLWYRDDPETGTIRVMTTREYQQDLVLYREEEVRVFTLQYPNATAIATALEDLFGERVYLSLGVVEDELAPGGTLAGARADAVGRGRFSRSGSTDRSFAEGAGEEGGALRRGEAKSEKGLLDEDLTPERIAELERRLAEAGRTGEVGADVLRGISRREAPIYVTVNRSHNLVVVRTSDDQALGSIERLVVDLDRPTPQVLLEMKILELTLGDSFRSVFDFELATGTDSPGPPSAQPVNPLLPGAAQAARNVLGSGNFPLEGGTLVYQFLNDNVRARIQLLERENRIEVLATPLLLAANNRPARIFVGEERVLTTGVDTSIITPATGATTTVVEPVTEIRDIGNTLIVVPKINADRSVTLFISHDASSVLIDSTTIPIVTAGGQVSEFAIDTVKTATVEATVVARDRLTIAIGGLIRNEFVETEERVPFLGEIPVIEFFFKKYVKIENKSELILLITPRVLFTPAEGEEASRERLEKLSRHPYVEKGDER
ncbi:MAG: type II secretory pathway, component PulD [Planctomycetes bacterium]|nr:type II secretory pathway, component PulD [Planctomycetota bacterium]